MPYEIIKTESGYKVCKKDNHNKCFSKKGMPKKRAIKQMKAIEMNEHKLDGGLRPLIGRIGGKNLLKKKIVKDFFPKDYENMTYVEPFIGGGSIFFYKEPSVKEVINDKDKKLISIYKGFQKYDGDKISADVDGEYNKDLFEEIKESKPKSEYGKFIKDLKLYKTSFFGKSKQYGSRGYIKSNYSEYKDRLKNVIILNKDYKEVIKKYDSPDTFFYLDPPYEKSIGLYDHYELPIKDVYDVLKNIKGKFLLSYNDSLEAKKIFKDYYIDTIKTKYTNPFKGGHDREIDELIISNYNPKLVGGVIDKDTYLKRQSKGVYPASMTYEQFADIENKDRQRIDAEISKLNEQNKQYEQFIKENPEMEEVICNYDENGDPNKTRTTMGQCKINNQKHFLKWEQENHPENAYFFRPALKAITKVGDLLVDAVPMPDIVKDIYKGAREATKDSIEGSGKPKNKRLFKKQLQKLNITEEEYLNYAKNVAKMRGYDPDKLELCADGKHKLKYNNVPFGAVGYFDFILYLHQVKEGLIPFEYAIEKMKNYRARATKIEGDWKKNKESPNNLAINIIW